MNTARQLLAVDLAGTVLALGGAWWLLEATSSSISLGDTHSETATLALVAFLTILSVSLSSRRNSAQLVAGLQLYSSALQSSTTAIAGCAIAAYITGVEGRALLAVLLVVLPIARIVTRWLLRQQLRFSYRRMGNQLPIALLVGVQTDLELALKADNGLGYQPITTASARSTAEVADAVQATGASAVVLDRQIGSVAEFRELVWKAEALGCKVMVSTPLGLMAPNDIVVVPTASHDLMVLSTASLRLSNRFTKRAFDLVIAPLAIAITFPVLVVAIIATLFTNGLPVLHRGTRIGRGGQPFTMYKIRTLEPVRIETSTHGHDSATLSAPKPEPQGATRVGKVLRRWSIDELPQFFQVVSGSMSLVGPRPRLPDEHSESALLLRRLNVRPGLTGLWQISGRGDLSLDQAAELDVRYVDSWSLFHDVVILVRTVKTVLTGKGAR